MSGRLLPATPIWSRGFRRSLLEGQAEILETIYRPEAYYARVFAALSLLPHPRTLRRRIRRVLWLAKAELSAFLRIDDGGGPSQGWVDFLNPFHQLFRQLPPGFKRDSVRFAWRVLRHCPDQTRFILPFILMGFHFFMFTFDHAVPELSSLPRPRIGAPRDDSPCDRAA